MSNEDEFAIAPRLSPTVGRACMCRGSKSERPGGHIAMSAPITVELREDGFINATRLCKAGGKYFSQWFVLESTKELMRCLQEVNGGADVVDKKVGGNHSGSWIHPDLAVPLAVWINPTFAIHVSKWINEWRAHAAENEQRYHTALAELRPSRRNLRERAIQEQLQQELEGEIEVETAAGRIDLLTDDRLIEIKTVSHWKHAIGQVLCYGIHYPDRQKCVYLFGEAEDRDVIEQACSIYDIEVVFLE